MMPQNCFLAALLHWRTRRWVSATLVASGTFLLLGLSTAVIPNPVFGREIAPTDWAFEVLVVTSVLSGLLFATYVREGSPPPAGERVARGGAMGAFLSYLAIGCPVCNKIVLFAVGTSGAIELFAPVQPYLGAAGIAVLAIALAIRLRGESTCALPQSRGDAATQQSPLPRTPDELTRP